MKLNGGFARSVNDGFNIPTDISGLSVNLVASTLIKGHPPIWQGDGQFLFSRHPSAYHQNILRRDLFSQAFLELHSAPAIAQSEATARFALSWPTMCLLSSCTISLGVMDDMVIFRADWVGASGCLLAVRNFFYSGVVIGKTHMSPAMAKGFSTISLALNSVFSSKARAAAWA